MRLFVIIQMNLSSFEILPEIMVELMSLPKLCSNYAVDTFASRIRAVAGQYQLGRQLIYIQWSQQPHDDNP